MIRIVGLLLILFSMIFSSCYNYYGKGVSGREFSTMTLPFSNSGAVKENYIQAGFEKGVDVGEEDENLGWGLSFHQGLSGSGFNAAWGPMLYGGVYKIEEVLGGVTSFEPGNYNFMGAGFRGQLGFEVDFEDKVKWEILGIQSILLFEWGDYSQFRKEYAIENPSEFDTADAHHRFLFTLYTSLRWRVGKKAYSGFLLGINYSTQEALGIRTICSLHLQTSRIGVKLNGGFVRTNEFIFFPSNDYNYFGSAGLTFRI